MKLSEKFIRNVIKNHLIKTSFPELLEGRRQREQLFKKSSTIKTIYSWYKENMQIGKIENPRIDDTELRWIMNNFDAIQNDLNINYSLNPQSNQPPISPGDIERIINPIFEFLKSKDSLNQIFSSNKNKLSKEEQAANNILGADINRYNSLFSLKNAVTHVESIGDIIGSASMESITSLGQFNGYTLYVPQNKKASIAFDSSPAHKTTTWCTTRRTGQNLFDGYTLRGGILFYFKKENVTDEEAAKKNEEGKYLDPYTRFCIGISKGSTEPNFPEKGKGGGGLIVDQDNKGIWKEKAQELLGSDFDSAIETITNYNKKVDNQLPFAKNFFKIIKSVKAVKDTIKDWTWPEQYDFLISESNNNSILSLAKSAKENNDEKPGILVERYAIKFKQDFEKDFNKIMSASSGEKAAKYCFYGMRQFKKTNICKDIINNKLLKEDDNTIDKFFNLVFANETLPIFASEGIDYRLTGRYLNHKTNINLEITDFNDWVSKSDDILINLTNSSESFKDIIENSKCEVAKKELSKKSSRGLANKLSNMFKNITADIPLSEDLNEIKVKKYLDEFNKINSFLVSLEYSNESFLIESTSIFFKILKSVCKKIRALSQSLTLEVFANVSQKLLSADLNILHYLIFKIFDKSNILPPLEDIPLYSAFETHGESHFKNATNRNLVNSFFYDVIADDDILNLKKFGLVLTNNPVKFYKILQSHIAESYGESDIDTILVNKFKQEIELEEDLTTIQDFFCEDGLKINVYATVLRKYIIPYLNPNASERKINPNDQSLRRFINKLSNSCSSGNSNSLTSKIMNSLSHYGPSMTNDFESMYNLLVGILNDESKYANEKPDKWSSKSNKVEIIEKLLYSLKQNNFSPINFLERAVNDKVVLHGENYNYFSMFFSRKREDQILALPIYVKYVLSNLDKIDKINIFSINIFNSSAFGVEEFKRIYDLTNGERICHYMLQDFFFDFSLASDQEISDLFKMIEVSIARHTIKHPSIDEDVSKFALHAISNILRSFRDENSLISKLKILKVTSPSLFSYFKDFMSQTNDPQAIQILSKVEDASFVIDDTSTIENENIADQPEDIKDDNEEGDEQ